ncbi:MAG: superoxide dismutase [Patescibacteria group bacterium]
MFELPKLPYSYDALEPYMDARTMELHHGKHHATYVSKLNEAIAKHPELESWTIEKLLSSLESVPDDIRTAVKNHGGGYLNHSFFWNVIGPNGRAPKGKLLEEIIKTFGSFDAFKVEFAKTAAGHFGSGWAWLVVDGLGKLKIKSLPNQDHPISLGEKPILCLDLWEHAYYLKYQNRRAEFIGAWWNVIDWEKVENNL